MIKKISDNVFKRYEKKYCLNSEQKRALEAIIQEHMELDKFCKQNEKYLIRNVYYDTINDDLIRKSIEKPIFKEKLRIRKYGTYQDGKDEYYLEIKRKYNGEVYKRRVLLNKLELDMFIDKSVFPIKDNYLDKQVLEEFQYFLSKNKLMPKVFICYERVAYFDKSNPSFRLTFDSNIYARTEDLSFDSDYEEIRLIDSDTFIMEIKITGFVPLWLSHAFAQLKIYPSSFSKYGTCFKYLKRKDLIDYVNV